MIVGQRKLIENDLIAHLESMPFEEARRKILHRDLGNDFDSDNHRLCLSWLLEEESVRKDKRDEETLSSSRKALFIARSAIILSIIMAIYEVIKWYSN